MGWWIAHHGIQHSIIRRFGSRVKRWCTVQHFSIDGRKMDSRWIVIREPWLSNLTENLVTVQFNHRYLVITTATFILIFVARKWSVVTKKQRNALLVIPLLSRCKFHWVFQHYSHFFGSLASMHQMGAIVLISSLVWAMHELSVKETIGSI